MQIITLYRIIRPDGGVTVSPVKPDGEYTELYRLIADDGMVLTNGETVTACTDTNTPDVWAEIVDAEYSDEATEEDYQGALRDMGVKL